MFLDKRAGLKEKRRQELLDFSLYLFVHKGYEGTTVRDIAKKANTSVGLLFHYFPTKEAIVKELIRLAEAGVALIVNQLTSINEPISGFERITKFILESFAEPTTKDLFLLVNQIKTFESVPDVMHNFPDTIQASLPVIINGQKAGEIKKGEPLALALAYWGAIQGIAEVMTWYPEAVVPDYQWIVAILRA